MLDSGIVAVISGIALCTFSTIIVALRLYCRWSRSRTIHLFDWFMIAALFVSWGNTAVNYFQVSFGKGIYFPDLVTPKRPQVERAIFGTLVTWYVYRMSYPLALCLVKFSILCFYHTLAASTKFRRVVTATAVFVGLYTLGTILAGAFQCRQPSDAWSIAGYLAWVAPPSRFTHGQSHHPRRAPKKCYNPTYLWTAFAGVNLLTDVVILFLPIPMLLALRLPLGKRLGLIGVFSLGFLAIVASSLRLWILTLWAESVASQQRFGTDLLLWGQVEVNSAIVSASIPFLKQLFTWGLGPSETHGSDDGEIEKGHSPVLEALVHGTKTRSDKKWGKKNKEMDFSELSLSSMGRPETGPGELGWKPFITVPQSLSSKDSSRCDSVTCVEDLKAGRAI